MNKKEISMKKGQKVTHPAYKSDSDNRRSGADS